ncbi:hypothetical protein [Dactylosporangium matsuzakiense]|uniref:Uncharacterized protein n=1 Tax=Dactylosporangium matsuzakiense TaxID=53360 RepID=A0A9W6NPF7_9ACTN|nr:hypothetical protein [Dactylosporangium matsuzakiense]UWZ41896.1 hypothetical protein Dmats_30260 [Dactylosporangium matsuzakiense]GLL04439.1 hypothetical protein GCM10017581_061860 [Dactylosporangium matsuzakiense]
MSEPDEPAPAPGRSFPIIPAALAIALLILLAAGAYIAVQVSAGRDAEADRAAADAAPRPQAPAPSATMCVSPDDERCVRTATRLPVGLDQLLEGAHMSMSDEWRNDSGTHLVSTPLDADTGARLSVTHAQQDVYQLRCEANSTGTSRLTAAELAFLKTCGGAALAGNDPLSSRAVEWLAANVNPAPSGSSQRFQCGAVLFSLKISALQSELDVVGIGAESYCGPV